VLKDVIPRRLISQLRERSYWRGFDDGRIFGKGRNIMEFFNDEQWLERLDGSTNDALDGIDELVKLLAKV